MEIRIEKAPPGNQALTGQRWMIWHRDCQGGFFSPRSGICWELRVDFPERKSLIECQHCRQRAWIPHGSCHHFVEPLEDTDE